MGTRLRYETMIKEKFPTLQRIRAHSPHLSTVTIYAEEENQTLSQATIKELTDFLADEGQAHLLHQVKPYENLVNDQIPEVEDPPEHIRIIALHGDLNQKGIVASLNSAFPFLHLQLAELKNGKLSVWIPSDIHLSVAERALVEQYIPEIVPLGFTVEII